MESKADWRKHLREHLRGQLPAHTQDFLAQMPERISEDLEWFWFRESEKICSEKHGSKAFWDAYYEQAVAVFASETEYFIGAAVTILDEEIFRSSAQLEVKPEFGNSAQIQKIKDLRGLLRDRRILGWFVD